MQGTGTGPTGALILALNGLMIVTGILIRRGRAWRLGLNVAAIALFIELTLLPSAFGVLFAAMDALVLFALIRHRAWFQWSPDDAARVDAADPDAADAADTDAADTDAADTDAADTDAADAADPDAADAADAPATTGR